MMDQGVPVVDYSAAPSELVIDGCWFEPAASTVVTDGRFAVRTGYVVDAPAGVDVHAADHVRIGGAEFALDGEPLVVPSPTGALDSTRFSVVLWEG